MAVVPQVEQFGRPCGGGFASTATVANRSARVPFE